MPGVDLNLSLPLVGDSLATIVAKFNVALAAIEDDLAARVTSGELDLNTAVSAGGNPITNVGGLRLLGGESTVVGTLYMDEELNIVTSYGTVKLTNLGTINVTALGTIGGDYGGVNPAAVTYVDISGEYVFTEEAGIYADLRIDDLILVGTAGSLRLSADAALTGTQSISFKSLPVGIGLLAYKSSDSTLVDASTVTVDILTATTLRAIGNVKGATVEFTTVRPRWIHASAGQVGNTGAGKTSFQLYDTGTAWTTQYGNDVATGSLMFPVGNDEGDTITEWHVRLRKNTSVATTWTMGLYKQSSWGALVLVGATQSIATNNPGDVTLGQTGLTELTGQNKYVIKVTTNTINADSVFGADVAYFRAL